MEKLRMQFFSPIAAHGNAQPNRLELLNPYMQELLQFI